MSEIQFKKGDVFATVNPKILGKAINCIQRIWANDGESKYSHTGIIIGDAGTVFEALWTVKTRDIYDAYAGKKIIIARPHASAETIQRELSKLISAHQNERYPYWRLALHILPPLAKIGFLGRLVCSEITAKYLYMIRIRHKKYKGTNPDTLVDEWRTWRAYDIVFEGVLLKKGMV